MRGSSHHDEKHPLARPPASCTSSVDRSSNAKIAVRHEGYPTVQRSGALKEGVLEKRMDRQSTGAAGRAAAGRGTYFFRNNQRQAKISTNNGFDTMRSPCESLPHTGPVR
jgi:hypothetical protein